MNRQKIENGIMDNKGLLIDLFYEEIKFKKKSFKFFYEKKNAEYDILLKRNEIIDKIIKSIL